MNIELMKQVVANLEEYRFFNFKETKHTTFTNSSAAVIFEGKIPEAKETAPLIPKLGVMGRASKKDLVSFFGDPNWPSGESCTLCQGSGLCLCPECNGTGEVECTCCECMDEHMARCPECFGNKTIDCDHQAEPTKEEVQERTVCVKFGDKYMAVDKQLVARMLSVTSDGDDLKISLGSLPSAVLVIEGVEYQIVVMPLKYSYTGSGIYRKGDRVELDGAPVLEINTSN